MVRTVASTAAGHIVAASESLLVGSVPVHMTDRKGGRITTRCRVALSIPTPGVDEARAAVIWCAHAGRAPGRCYTGTAMDGSGRGLDEQLQLTVVLGGRQPGCRHR
jgi:hypothetical protein